MLTFDFAKKKNCCSIGSWHLTGRCNCSWCQIPATPTINERLGTALERPGLTLMLTNFSRTAFRALDYRNERVGGCVQKYLHRGSLQTGVWHRRAESQCAAAPQTCAEMQLRSGGLRSPAQEKSACLQLAPKIQAQKMDFRRYCGGTDCWNSAHSPR